MRIALALLLLAPRIGFAQEPRYPPPAQVKADFLKLIDRPRVPLDAKVLESLADEKSGLVTERLDFATAKTAAGVVERVPTIIVRPDRPAKVKRRPAVLVLHGTGGNKDGSKGLLVELAKRGIVGVAIDGRYHGDRAGGAKGADAYNAAIVRAWRSPPGEPREHPFYFDTCWDIFRTLDYLQTRDDVDPDRLGLIGFSKGGIETWLAGAVDDRVKVAVPAIGVQSFRWSLENGRWQGRASTIGAASAAAAHDLGREKVDRETCLALWDKVIPGILGEFDCPSMLRLFAGRSLLILNGELDPNCPIEGAEIAFDSARQAFAKSGDPDKLKIDLAKGVGHQVTGPQNQAALDWLVRGLEP